MDLLRLACPFLLAAGFSLVPSVAHAADDKQKEKEKEKEEIAGDFVDGSANCAELEASTERALAAWEKAQAPVAYREPLPDTLLGAPWGPLFKWMGDSKPLLAA